MDKNLEMLSSQEHMTLSEIDMIYKLKSKSLIPKGLKILGITFWLIDKEKDGFKKKWK